MSKKFSALALVVAVAALGVTVIPKTVTPEPPPAKETTYARVMRTKTLRCGYSLWPSQTDMDPNTKQLTGLVPDFANALADKLGLKIEWVQEVVWGTEAETLRTGKIDAICASDGPWVTTGAAFVDYVTPMFYVPVYLYGRAGETRFQTMADVNNANVTLSAVDGDISMSLAVDKFPNAKRIAQPAMSDPALAITNVMTGKTDLTTMSPQTVNAVNKNNETKLEKVFPDPIVVVNSSFAVEKGQPELLQLLNQGFAILHQFGIADTIIDKIDPEQKMILRAAKPYR